MIDGLTGWTRPGPEGRAGEGRQGKRVEMPAKLAYFNSAFDTGAGLDKSGSARRRQVPGAGEGRPWRHATTIC